MDPDEVEPLVEDEAADDDDPDGPDDECPVDELVDAVLEAPPDPPGPVGLQPTAIVSAAARPERRARRRHEAR